MLVKQLKKVLEKLDDDTEVLIALNDKFPIEVTGAEKDTYFKYDEDKFQGIKEEKKLNCVCIQGESDVLLDRDELEDFMLITSSDEDDFEYSLDENWRGEEGNNY